MVDGTTLLEFSTNTVDPIPLPPGPQPTEEYSCTMQEVRQLPNLFSACVSNPMRSIFIDTVRLSGRSM